MNYNNFVVNYEIIIYMLVLDISATNILLNIP